jgi:hypothetical protein
MRLQRANPRRGIILLVVLALLTLFAIVGITFVLYSDGEASAARIAREAESQQRADVDPEQALAFFLGQLIYDVNDNDASGVGVPGLGSGGAFSGLRGHSLARTMYGYNYAALGVPGTNIIPYNGVGRLHYPATPPILGGADDYTLVNYTWFNGDGFLRDPERYGTRGSPLVAQSNAYVGGNAPYTYPDLNSFFLAAVNAYGQLLTPSYHRKWLFNPTTNFNDMTNPNWINAQGRYLTLRPRPAEHPQFPIPDDPNGDVKNLLWTEGGNDSIWIDLGAPVMTAPDGTQYKMLFAPLIMDLDGRINLNTAGNILGPGNSHVSNQGWGPWEVNLAKVLYADQAVNTMTSPYTYTTPPTEYINLLTGRNLGSSSIFGRYAATNTPTVPTMPGQLTSPGVPTPAGQPSPAGTGAHFYAPVDYDARVTTGGLSARIQPPGFGGPATSCFPTFDPNSYLNGGAENVNHPLLYDAVRQAMFNGTSNRVFHSSDMESLMRPNSNFLMPFQRSPDSGSSALLSDLLRLCPNNLGLNNNNARLRNLVTTLSMDLATPALSPNWWNGMAPGYMTVNPNGAQFAPFGQAVPFPALPPNAGITNAAGTAPLTSEFGTDWRALSAAPITYTTNNPFTYTSPGGRIQLNRPLPPYPHMGSGLIPPYGGALVTWTAPGTSYNLGNPAITNQYTAAVNARQALANDIYRRLLALSGIAPPANSAAPAPTDLAPRRWLAQLAVNIVDFIDDDDINTPFNFYTTTDGLAAASIAATQGNDDANPTGANPLYWVFGTELPKVVLNEALAEAQNSTPSLAKLTAGDTVNVWVELFNTMQTPPAAPAQQQDGFNVNLYMSGGYSPYRITIAQTLMNQPPGGAGVVLPDNSANVLGKPYIVAPFSQNTADADFKTTNTISVYNPATPGSGFFLVGPTPPTPAKNYQDPFTDPTIPAGTPTVRTVNMSYTPTWAAGVNTDERTTGLTVMLRRLANPYLPYNGTPGVNYNPYVTIDYIQNVPIRSNGVPSPNGGAAAPVAPFASRGKRQPYAGYTQVNGVGPSATTQATSPTSDQPPPAKASGVNHTLGQPNTPLPQSGHYDWLVHLDRQVISPIELLHVTGYQPYQLTQQFMQGSDTVAANMFQHYAPWLDVPPGPIANVSTPWWYNNSLPAGSTHRLYRLFEFLECGDRAFGANGLGRIPGKVNINTIYDGEILQALIDANPSIGLPVVPSNRPASAADPIVQLVGNMMQSRSPSLQYNMTVEVCGGLIGPTNTNIAAIPPGYILDRPFLPLGTGASQGGLQYPNGVSVQDTLLRSMPNTQLLFQNPGAATANPAIPPDTSATHPYLQTQLLTKLYNNVTTRSNTFAVFVTVGFFQVIPGGAVGQSNVPQLGPEIGRSEGRQIRHRMFAIVDRTNLGVGATTYAGGAISVTPASGPQTVPLALSAAGGANPYTGASWSLAPGLSLVFEPGTDNEETVVAQAAGAGFQATFLKSHPPGVIVMVRGNPGPWSLQAYDPRKDPLVVRYYSIID